VDVINKAITARAPNRIAPPISPFSRAACEIPKKIKPKSGAEPKAISFIVFMYVLL